MDEWLMQKLRKITAEEQAYLDGDIQVKKDIYTLSGGVQKTEGEDTAGCRKRAVGQDKFEVDCQLFLREGKLITVRHHSRFIDFPLHKHNYMVGGGSSMDTGKAIGIIINNPEFEDVRSLEGVAPTKNETVFTIAVPTTAGTAAEATINYVITDVEKKRKFVCVDTNDIPNIAIVDPDMMSTMPRGLTAATGMDALTHAIEGYTTKAAWDLADCLNLEAIRLIAKSLQDAVENKPEGREGMALGQYVTGMAFSNVGLGIAHSMAHTLGAVYDTPHGVACAMMLPIVMEYNADCSGEKYREIARAMNVSDVDKMSQEEYRAAAIEAVKKLSADVGIPAKLEALKEEDLEFLAESAYADACRPGNPKDTNVGDLKELFRKLM